MCGWGFWGSDIRDKVTLVLDALDGGKMLASEQAYIDAMERAFPCP